jgi:hypothetical protein
MVKFITALFKRKPKYRRLELRPVSYSEGNKLITESANKPESEQWHIAKEEERNFNYRVVYLERRILIKKK